MKNGMIKTLCLLLAACMALTLAACGKDTPETTEAPSVQTEQPTEQTVPEVTERGIPEDTDCLDPGELEWGYDAPGTSVMDTEHWYPDGDKTSPIYLFFEDDRLKVVDGGESESIRTKTVDRHLVDLDTEGTVFDFVFPDVFTCCDLVSGQWYARADLDAVVSSLTAVTWVTGSEGQWRLTFSEDGTLVFDDDGTPVGGTWWMDEAHLLRLRYEDGQGGWMNVNYAEDSWQVTSLEDADEWYPEP